MAGARTFLCIECKTYIPKEEGQSGYGSICDACREAKRAARAAESAGEKETRLQARREGKAISKQADQKVAEKCQTCTEWWEFNRQQLTAQQQKEYAERHGVCLDLIHLMENPMGEADKAEDYYLTPEQVNKLIVDHVNENGVVHLGHWYTHEKLHGGVWSEKFWRTNAINLLVDEGKPTALYANFGWLIALPDHLVYQHFRIQPNATHKKIFEFLGYELNDKYAESAKLEDHDYTEKKKPRVFKIKQ